MFKSKEQKEKDFYERTGLTDLDPVTEKMIKRSVSEKRWNKFVWGTSLLSIPKLEDQVKMNTLIALSEQNFVLIKQNDEQIKLQREILKEMQYQTDMIIKYNK